jgi:hypothetical protein
MARVGASLWRVTACDHLRVPAMADYALRRVRRTGRFLAAALALRRRAADLACFERARGEAALWPSRLSALSVAAPRLREGDLLRRFPCPAS